MLTINETRKELTKIGQRHDCVLRPSHCYNGKQLYIFVDKITGQRRSFADSIGGFRDRIYNGESSQLIYQD